MECLAGPSSEKERESDYFLCEVRRCFRPALERASRAHGHLFQPKKLATLNFEHVCRRAFRSSGVKPRSLTDVGEQHDASFFCSVHLSLFIFREQGYCLL